MIYLKRQNMAKATVMVFVKDSSCGGASDKSLEFPSFSGPRWSDGKCQNRKYLSQSQHFCHISDLSLLLFFLAGKRKISLKSYLKQETRYNDHAVVI